MVPACFPTLAAHPIRALGFRFPSRQGHAEPRPAGPRVIACAAPAPEITDADVCALAAFIIRRIGFIRLFCPKILPHER